MVLPVLALCLAAAPPAASAFPFPATVTKLPNGLTVARVPASSPGLAAYYSVVRTGSRNEVEAGLTGFAHFFEHVMFKGTKAWPEGSRGNLLGSLGFSENAYTSDDVTVYHVSGPTSSLEKLIELEADRFLNLDFSEETFQTEAKAVLGEYHKNAASPGLKIEETLNAAAFAKHTYRHTTLGFYEDIKAMPTRYAYSKEFFKRWYTPDNVIVFVVGDFDDAKVMEWMQKYYGPWKGTAAKVVIPQESAIKGKDVKLEWDKPTLPRAYQAWITPAASLTAKDAAVAEVLGEYLVGETSPTFKTLVLEQQLVEHLGADSSPHRDPALFTLAATLKAEKDRDAVNAALTAAVKELQAGKVDAARVEAIRSHSRYALLMGLETPDQIADHLAYMAGVLGSPQAAATFQQQLSQVEPKDLVAYAKKHLTAARRNTLAFSAGAAK